MIPELNAEQIQSGERLSFINLFNHKEFQIAVPIIQRDYAQGRQSTAEIRDVFLDTLYNYLDENRSNRDLDFVYGTLTPNDDGDLRFIPLDGQQRLTTLFLLHWYLAGISGNQQNFKATLSDRKHSRFTYETRTNSREFCDALIENIIDFGNLLDPEDGKNNALSRTIQNQGWYYLSWEYDPTIKAMLVMLDALHGKFETVPHFYERLVREEDPVITFLFLNLNQFKLTDDLYIKMNSRGKPLSPFENFKAKIEQHIGLIDWSSEPSYKLTYGDQSRDVSVKEYFAHQIDTAWADLFWNYRNKAKAYSAYDDQMTNYMRVVLTGNYASGLDDSNDILEYLLGTQTARRRKDYYEPISYHKYNGFRVLTEEAVVFLIDSFDRFWNGTGKIKTHLANKFYFDESSFFNRVLDDDLNLTQRVQFYAYIAFLVRFQGDTSGMDDWMRVIHNLAVNTEIDRVQDLVRAITSINTLLPNAQRILEYLVDTASSKVEYFYSRQVQEERIKAMLIQSSGGWKDKILQIEQHPYLAGQIMFTFEFSGVLSYFEERGNIAWSAAEDQHFQTLFSDYANAAIAALGMLSGGKNVLVMLERAVLTKGDYLLETSANRKNFLSTTKNPRDYSWKRLLRLPPDNDKKLEQKRGYFKALLDDPRFSVVNAEESLTTIIRDSRTGGWREYFIKHPMLIMYCEQGFIRFDSSSSIKLFKHSQANHTQVEMYSYNLFTTRIFNKLSAKPFAGCFYFDVRSSDDYPCIIFYDYAFKKVLFNMEVMWSSGRQQFCVSIYKTKGNKKLEYYPDLVAEKVCEAGLEWEESEECFLVYTNNEIETINAVNSLLELLPLSGD